MVSCNGQEGKTKDSSKVLTAIQDTTTENSKPYFKQSFESAIMEPTFNIDDMVTEFVRTIFQDKSGNIWFGTNREGVIRYDGDYLEKFTIREGFGGTSVREIAQDKEGNVWFGSSGGLTKYDGKSFTNFSEKDGLINNEIWSLEIDGNGIIWIGTVEGVSRFDGEAFTSFTIPHAPVKNPTHLLSDKRISSIIEDKNGNIWFGTDGFGICKYDPIASIAKGVDVFTHLTKENGLCDNNIADILEDEKGNIWVGTMFGGLSRYDGKSFTNFTQNGIITGKEAYNLCEDKKGNIWFSAENIGVYRYDGRSFTQFNTEDGLATNGVQSILTDEEGFVWFGTWSGLSLYDGKSFYGIPKNGPWCKN